MKTKIKQAKIVRVLRADGGLIGGRLQSGNQRVCKHAGRCAVGALLIGAGVSPTALFNYQRNYGAGIMLPHPIRTRSGEVLAAAALLEREYGLTIAESQAIMSFNDDCEISREDDRTLDVAPKLRMEAVIAFIENGLNEDAGRRVIEQELPA